MVDPVDELRTAAVRLKRDIDELTRKIEDLPRTNVAVRDRDAAIPEERAILIAQRAIGLYADRHPRPIQVTMTQAAQMLGLSRHTVRNLMKAGSLSFNGCGLIPIEQVDKILTTER